jgi:uncharacterized membrane protein YgaE (UPF0421/DUF939 family)
MTKQYEFIRLIAFAVRCSASAMLAYELALRLSLSYPIWALISAIVVSQEQWSETWISTGRRIAGTILGACVALLVNALVGNAALANVLSPPFVGMTAQVAISVAICAVITHRLPLMRVSMWTCAIILLTAKPPDPLYQTALYRGSEVILGGLIGSLLHLATDRLLAFLNRIEAIGGKRAPIESVAEE